jgi:hypothetical protein
VTGQGFIDGVIHDLEDHVMQTAAVIGITDVHSGSLSYGVETFQDFDFTGVVDVVICHYEVLLIDRAF